MSPVGHLQYGWWVAHWKNLNRRERAAIALAGAACDLDGLSILAGGGAYYRYHHILFHNLGSALALIPLAGIFFWRRPIVWLLAIFSFGMHVVEDYFTIPWVMRPWAPFSASTINLDNHLPAWVVQYVFQTAAMLFILAMTVWIYLRHQRTPLEIISPALDRLLVNYAALPWWRRCSCCPRRAHFRCDRCGRTVCAQHGKVVAGLQAQCVDCPSGVKA